MSASSSSRRRPSPAPGEQQVVADDELVSRLRALLPRESAAANGKASSRTRVLWEACVYIRRLHAEVDAAAERLARLQEDDPSVAAIVGGTDVDDAADGDELIRNLL